MNNVILIWMPGSGKTSIGRLLSRKLWMEVIDFDDDIIEVEMKKSCASVLEELWEEKFLKLEEELALNLKLENKILSCSWSVPLNEKVMEYLNTIWEVIYLNIIINSIEKRLKRMKVDRIIWMTDWNKTIKEILGYREPFFQKAYKYKFDNEWLGTKDDTFNKFWKWFKKLDLGFKETKLWDFIETRWNDWKNSKRVKFSEAILHPGWSFGWLYVPETIPYLDLEFLKKHINSNYKELSIDLLKRFNIDIEQKDLEEVISIYEKFDDKKNPVPIIKIKEDLFSAELYHWPTRAFKDIALQPFGALLSKLTKKEKKDFLIMIATSWDTWPAALESLSNKENIKAVCIYPNNWTSEVQRLQMITNSADNVLVLSVAWNFDTAQTSLKEMLHSQDFKEKLNKNNISLSAANSVNFGRIIFQIIFHIHYYLELVRSWEIKIWEEIKSIVPSWNFWNVLWGYYARKMWIPIKEFLISSNENNVLTDFINTWIYDLRWREFKKTSAPAMDILISSNIERILFYEFWPKRTKELLDCLKQNYYYELTEDEKNAIQDSFKATFSTNWQIRTKIKEYYEQYWYLMDPHTATWIKSYEEDNSQMKKILCSTAEWTKFSPTVLRALNESDEKYSDKFALKEISKKINIPVTSVISDLFDKKINHTKIIERKDVEKCVLEFLNIK